MKIRTIVLDSGAERYLDYAKKKLLELNRRRQFYGQSFSKDVIKIDGATAYLFCSDFQLSLILRGGSVWLYPWFVFRDAYANWHRFVGYYNDTKTYDHQVEFSPPTTVFGGAEFESGLLYYAKQIAGSDYSYAAEIHTINPKTTADSIVFTSEFVPKHSPASGYSLSGMSFTQNKRYLAWASNATGVTSFVRVYTQKWEFVEDLVISPEMANINGIRASKNGVVIIGTTPTSSYSQVVIFDKNGKQITNYDLSVFGVTYVSAAAADPEKFYVRGLTTSYSPVPYYMWDKKGVFLGGLKEGTWSDDSSNSSGGLMQWDKYGNAEINLIDTTYSVNAEVRIEQADKTRVSEYPASGWYFAHCFIGKDYKTPGTQAFIGAANL